MRKKHIYKRLMAVLLACAMLVAVTSVADTSKAVALDANKTCSLVVHTFAYIPEEFVEIELYRVADISEVNGEIVFTTADNGPYTDLQDGLNKMAKSDEKGKVDEEDEEERVTWDGLAQQALRVALDENGGQTPAATGEGIDHVAFNELQTGLYLLVVHGENEPGFAPLHNTDGDEVLVTTVTGASNLYTVFPNLVYLPGRDGGGNGDWFYNVEIVVKADCQARSGGLEISNTLTSFAQGSPAAFVFQVEATLGGVSVYSDVVTIIHTGVGEVSVTIDKIPVGAYVTVKEVYSSARHKLVSDSTQTAVIIAEVVASVEFTNEATNSAISGGGITNQFTYGEDGWHWTPVPFSS